MPFPFPTTVYDRINHEVFFFVGHRPVADTDRYVQYLSVWQEVAKRLGAYVKSIEDPDQVTLRTDKLGVKASKTSTGAGSVPKQHISIIHKYIGVGF